MKKNNDNFWKLHVPFIMTGGIVFVLALVFAMAYDTKKIKRMEKAQNTKVANIDSQIKSANAKIDSLYDVSDSLIADSLARHPEYQWVVQNQGATDSLRGVNQELLSQAYNAARKNSMMTIVRRNETLFSDFSDVPAVRNVKWKYYANKKKIQEFDHRAPFVAHVPDAVRAHFYTSANKQVHDLQMKIDSLLNEKKQLIR
ncbi:MAG: hypothetical protein IJE82_03495 [Alphaproteobacteria bacterium]|nr:hypothetical protein [Alphaproteobacteria bacterium]